jgi:hypothetical protein
MRAAEPSPGHREKIPDFLKTQRIIRLNDVDRYLDDLKTRICGVDHEQTG